MELARAEPEQCPVGCGIVGRTPCSIDRANPAGVAARMAPDKLMSGLPPEADKI